MGNPVQCVVLRCCYVHVVSTIPLFLLFRSYVDTMTSTPEEVLARLERYAAPASIVGKHEKKDVLALTHEVLRLLADEYSTLVAHASEKAVLQSLSVDGTPIKVKQTLTTGGVQGKNVRRRVGQDSLELLCMVTWLRFMTATGECETRCRVAFPKPLRYGKDAWCVFGCVSEFQTTLRDQGHTGIAVEHAVMDRALFSSIWRKQKQRVTLAHHKLHVGGMSTEEVNLLNLKSWCVGTGCAAHDSHKCLQWGLQRYLSNADLLRDCCIVMESIRNSYTALASSLVGWIGEKLVRVPPCEEGAGRLALWQHLGVDADIIDLLCEMELRWGENELCISETYASSSGDVIGDISLCILAVLRVRKYSDSRWLTIGVSCKTLLAACLLGLCDLVAHVRAQHHTSDFYLHGFTRLSKDLKLFLVLGAAVSYVGDALLHLVLEDSRLVKYHQDAKSAVLEELLYLESLPHAVVGWLASFCDRSVLEVRDAMLSAAHTSFAFLQMRVFAVMEQYPWTLAEGDIGQNLILLQSSAEPLEPVSRKVWRLLKYKLCDVHEIVAGLRLLLSVPWAATAVEQLHGSVATYRKYRPELELQQLLPRSYLHMVRSLFRTDPEYIRMAKIKEKLLHLLQKRVGAITGRHAFVKAFYSAAQLLSPSDAIATLPKQVMMAHGSKWAGMSMDALDYYDRLALTVQEESTEKRESERARLADALRRSAARFLLGKKLMQTFARVL
eukprot:6472763-Amphidinium_carterae.2